ncbi:MAG: DNA cytosine methyltransferase, partial [Actinobacteria bacterium]|nr:DNA cytosine methyltransferase [Actinomycetota bacterium]
MRWDGPSGTITTGFLTPGRGRFVHAVEPRGLSPREGARLQGYPDSYSFENTSEAFQVSNYSTADTNDVIRVRTEVVVP